MKRVKESFVAERDGSPVVVQRGRTIGDDHPLVQRYPDKFEDVSVDIRHWEPTTKSVETATAAPGEQRSLTTVPSETVEVDPSLPTEPITENDFSLAEVKALAVKAGIDVSGTKGQIVQRFNERFEE